MRRCARLWRCINTCIVVVVIITIIIIIILCHLMTVIFEISPLQAILLIGYVAASISVYLSLTEYTYHTVISATNWVYLSDTRYTGNQPGIPTRCLNRVSTIGAGD